MPWSQAPKAARHTGQGSPTGRGVWAPGAITLVLQVGLTTRWGAVLLLPEADVKTEGLCDSKWGRDHQLSPLAPVFRENEKSSPWCWKAKVLSPEEVRGPPHFSPQAADPEAWGRGAHCLRGLASPAPT